MPVCARLCGVTWIVGEDFCDLVLHLESVSNGWVGDLVEGGQVVFRYFVLGRHVYQISTVVIGHGFRKWLLWLFSIFVLMSH